MSDTCPMCGMEYSNHEDAVTQSFIDGIRNDAVVCRRDAKSNGILTEYEVWVHV